MEGQYPRPHFISFGSVTGVSKRAGWAPVKNRKEDVRGRHLLDKRSKVGNIFLYINLYLVRLSLILYAQTPEEMDRFIAWRDHNYSELNAKKKKLMLII